MPIIRTNKELRPRNIHDFYPTPVDVCKATLKNYLISYYDDMVVLDAGCGEGVWGQALHKTFPYAISIGIDDRAVNDEYYDTVLKGDYRDFNFGGEQFDLVMGNPPYKFAEEFIRKSITVLRDNGQILFLLRLAFLESQKRLNGLWKEFPPTYVHVLGKRPSFMGDVSRKTDSDAYAIFDWRFGVEKKSPEIDWLDWDYEKEN